MDLESEISNEDEEVLDEESMYERISALKDMLPPSARRTITSSVSTLTSFTKASLSFSGRALWVISTSAFLIGVPWALAYAEEEQYIQLEREQGMIKGANEVCFLILYWLPLAFSLQFVVFVPSVFALSSDSRQSFPGVSLVSGGLKIFHTLIATWPARPNHDIGYKLRLD